METIMQKAALDPQKSKSLYLQHPRQYKAKECYANVYRAITDNFSKVNSGKWKIAYGFYTISDLPNLLGRHCFFLDEDDKVIDPTIFTHAAPNLNHQYYVFYIFDSIKDYYSEVEKADYHPALLSFLRPYEEKAHLWAKIHDYILF